MAKKIIKKSLPWFLIIGVIFVITFALQPTHLKVKADDASTSVSVGNVAPTMSSERESPESSSTNPTNEGDNATFKATGSDANNDQYYLAICSSNAITAHSNAAPTCDVTQYCVSSATSSGSEATCSKDTTGLSSESYTWYAFSCDKTTSNFGCSAAGQGAGATGSPFAVNHRPSFTAIGVDDTTPDPGQTLTVTTTASDSDTSASVTLHVCKDVGFSGGVCTSGEWCNDTRSSNPTCQFNVPDPQAAGNIHYVGYVLDDHGFAASGGKQAYDNTAAVNNVSPTVSSVTINGGSAITLTESSTKNVVATADVTDHNGCADVDGNGNAAVSIYRTGIGWSGCQGSSNENNCYALQSCVYNTGSCTGGIDITSAFTCTVAVYYNADPTGSNTKFPSDTWKDTVKATDDGSATGNTEVTSGVQMNSLAALDVTNTITYGSLIPGQASASDQGTTVSSSGNTGLDPEYSGADMTDGASYSIPMSQQKYDFTGSKAWASMDYTLSGTPTSKPLHVLKTTAHGSPAQKSNYWRIKIPDVQETASYTGTNTMGAYASDPVNW
jgi:hypothetical protein